MTSSQCVIGSKKMQLENLHKNVICRLCLSIISYTNSKIIEVVKEVLEVLPNLNLEEIHKHRMCIACSSKLVAAFNFKSKCMLTEDIISSLINAGHGPVIEIKELYLKANGNIQLADMSENQKICRLCLQLTIHGFVSLNEVDSDIIDTSIPFVNISATKNPVVCRLCFDSLRTHGGFVTNCIEAQRKYKSIHAQPYIKTEEIEIKEENGHEVQDLYQNDKPSYINFEDIEIKREDSHNVRYTYQNVDKPCYIQFEEIKIKLEDDQVVQEDSTNIDKKPYIKSEEIEMKSEEGDQDNNSYSQNLYEGTIKNKKKNISKDIVENMLECETNVKINECKTSLSISSYKNRYKRTFEGNLRQNIVPKQKHSLEIRIFKCDRCSFETKFKNNLKMHQVIHKDSSEIEMYKCDTCTYETKYKRYLKIHQVSHKDPSEIKMYKCDKCDYESKRRGELRGHLLTHKDPSEIQMYKCNICTYEAKYKKSLKDHQLTHKDPSEIQMYMCDACAYKTKRKGDLKSHMLLHKDPSKIQMYKCDTCTFETKYRTHLKNHQLTHKDPSEVQMYKCVKCGFETKFKHNLKLHQIKHKDSWKNANVQV